ncbi:MAG TPA: hypothetical protein VGQ10_00620 [Vicinamibacterales bacterium]|nr:hypothetical protein [Vicinamibacterales bacterium]
MKFTRWFVALVFAAGAVSSRGATPKFFPDDPIAADVETQDASGVAVQDLSDPYDFLENTFMNPADTANIRAENVNTLDEVPDSSWFTNRILARPMSVDEIVRGSVTGGAPKGPWLVVGAKTEGITPGMTVRDARNDVYFIKFDPPSNPEMATGAEVVTTPVFHALGYNVPENYLATIRREDLRIDPTTLLHREITGQRTPMTEEDLTTLLAKAARNPDGSYRVVASKAVEGKPLGPFRYYSTRSDDPNDIFSHEHRRELRAMRVFAAWLNHDDSRSINSLDTLVRRDGRALVKHHLIDFGSTLGSGSTQAQKPRAGNEYLWEARPTFLTMLTLGFYVRPWIKVRYPDMPSVGRFEGAFFSAEQWKPEYPNPAFGNARADDLFWAARRVAAFSDDAIRAVVKTGQFSDPRAEIYIGDVIILRRDKAARCWLNATNPVIDFAMERDGTMTFRNASADLRFGPAAQEYRVAWARFDNNTGEATAVGQPSVVHTPRAQAPRELQSASYIRASVTSHHAEQPNWVHPVYVFFRHTNTGWRTVGLERIVDRLGLAGDPRLGTRGRATRTDESRPEPRSAISANLESSRTQGLTPF